MKCPFCGGKIEEHPDNYSMSDKRREIYAYIRNAGPKGVVKSDLAKRFFPRMNKTTIRTTIYHINRAIKPLRIESRNTRVRILPELD